VFRRRLGTAAPGAVVASPTGDGAVPVWEHLLETVGAPPGCWREPVAVPPAFLAEGRRALEGAGWDGRTPLLVAHPGAGGPAKRWPVGGFVESLGRVQSGRRLSVVVNQGPADREAATSLAAQLGGEVFVLKQASLTALAGALAHARAYLGNDSGPSHLATALGVPSVILFGAARLAWRPWGGSARLVVVDTDSLEQGDVAGVRDALAALLV
jgi:ADP-heptose:LPS heptosyltransferase